MIDFVFEVETMPHTFEKYQANNAQIVGGGGAANAACAIVNLGGCAQLAARVGDDFIGNMIIDDLKRHQVDCSLLAVSKGARSSYSSVLLDSNGERQIVNFRGCGFDDGVDLIKRSSPEVVLTDTRWTAGAVAALELAKVCDIPAVLDAEAPIDPALLELATHIAFSRQGLESIAGKLNGIVDIESALRFASEHYSAWLAMTDGANGVYTLHQGQFFHYPVRSIDVVDTLGAGDVWHGAFAYWLGCGNSEADAVEFASAAASLKCLSPGGGRSCPDISEVKRYLLDDSAKSAT